MVGFWFFVTAIFVGTLFFIGLNKSSTDKQRIKRRGYRKRISGKLYNRQRSQQDKS